MIDLCYENLTFKELVTMFPISTENDFENLKNYVNQMYNEGNITWYIKDNKEIVKEKLKRNVMNSDAVITDMISYVRHDERLI
jgi:hypothetical protein